MANPGGRRRRSEFATGTKPRQLQARSRDRHLHNVHLQYLNNGERHRWTWRPALRETIGRRGKVARVIIRRSGFASSGINFLVSTLA
eukprot:scaffold2733_cov255-Pinguiococcus_pyrenoidosus.AAC.7